MPTPGMNCTGPWISPTVLPLMRGSHLVALDMPSFDGATKVALTRGVQAVKVPGKLGARLPGVHVASPSSVRLLKGMRRRAATTLADGGLTCRFAPAAL